MKALARDRKTTYANPIICSECGCSGGTLIKVGENHYVHQNKDKCMILRCKAKENK